MNQHAANNIDFDKTISEIKFLYSGTHYDLLNDNPMIQLILNTMPGYTEELQNLVVARSDNEWKIKWSSE